MTSHCNDSQVDVERRSDPIVSIDPVDSYERVSPYDPGNWRMSQEGNDRPKFVDRVDLSGSVAGQWPAESASRKSKEHLAPGIPRLWPSNDFDRQIRSDADHSEPEGSVGRRPTQSVAWADRGGIGSDGRSRLCRGLPALIRSSPGAVAAGRLLNLAVGVHPVILIPDAGTPLVLGDCVRAKASTIPGRGEIALSANRAITGGSVTRSVISRSRVPGRGALLGGHGSGPEPDQAEGKSSTPDRSKVT